MERADHRRLKTLAFVFVAIVVFGTWNRGPGLFRKSRAARPKPSVATSQTAEELTPSQLADVDLGADDDAPEPTPPAFRLLPSVPGAASLNFGPGLLPGLRVACGTGVRFQALYSLPEGREGLAVRYEWSATHGAIRGDGAGPGAAWDAPQTETAAAEVVCRITHGEELLARRVLRVRTVQPRVLRVHFLPDLGAEPVTLIDAVRGPILPPQYDLGDAEWEFAADGTAREALAFDHVRDDGRPFKNESVAYVRGQRMRLVAEPGLDAPGTAKSPGWDWPALPSPVRISVRSASPALSFVSERTGSEHSRTIELTALEPSAPSPQTIAFRAREPLGSQGIEFHWEFDLQWRFEVRDSAGRWIGTRGDAATCATRHRSLCVCDARPLAANPVRGTPEWPAGHAYEKAMQFSCDWAAGLQSGSPAKRRAIVEALYAGISQHSCEMRGPRQNVSYSFRHGLTSFTLQALLAGPPGACDDHPVIDGSCQHLAEFFAALGLAQGIPVSHYAADVFLPPEATPLDLQRTPLATAIAVSLPDRDGDWNAMPPQEREPPTVDGRRPWCFNRPYPAATGSEHQANGYVDDDGPGGMRREVVYDPSFSRRFEGSFPAYLRSIVSHYYLSRGSDDGEWIDANDPRLRARVAFRRLPVPAGKPEWAEESWTGPQHAAPSQLSQATSRGS